jgi:hypothetical protein
MKGTILVINKYSHTDYLLDNAAADWKNNDEQKKKEI